MDARVRHQSFLECDREECSVCNSGLSGERPIQHGPGIDVGVEVDD